jgi:formate hydrogenlyase subunit 3/multisubunit Na+/H+ antiporter MnhD subunit
VTALLWGAWLAPLVLAALVPAWRSERIVAHVAILAPLPALALALWAEPGESLHLPWVLFGMRLGLDETGRVFLLLTALLWTLGGAFSAGYLRGDPKLRRYVAFFLVTQAGNLLVVLCQDIATFYLGFALMTFSAFGLVVHDGTRKALRAGRVYIAMAILGEATLLVAFVLMAAIADSAEIESAVLATADHPAGAVIVPLLVLGFGVKAGLPLLHMWLPLAHPVAPTPASAVLSGSIVKAGLLGWLRFLPLGQVAYDWGMVLAAAGVVAMFGAVVLGLAQRDSKTALAYSTVSQMGYATVAVGAGLAAPQAWALLLPAVAVYALHHGLAKSALFLGVGVARSAALPRGVVALGLLLPAATLAGAPFTSGVLVKDVLGDALGTLDQPTVRWLLVLLPFAALGTSLLMARVLALAWREHGKSARHTGLAVPWAAALAAVAAAAWLAPAVVALEVPPAWKGVATLLGAWPVLAGFGIGALAVAFSRRRPRAGSRPRVPAGDVLVLIERWGWPVLRTALRVGFTLDARYERRQQAAAGAGEREEAKDRASDGAGFGVGGAGVQAAESKFETWISAGTALLALGALLVVALLAG